MVTVDIALIVIQAMTIRYTILLAKQPLENN
jgi:hypothetical protein